MRKKVLLMQTQKFYQRSGFWFCCTLLWCVVIFCFSAQDATQSNAVSNGVLHKIARNLHRLDSSGCDGFREQHAHFYGVSHPKNRSFYAIFHLGAALLCNDDDVLPEEKSFPFRRLVLCMGILYFLCHHRRIPSIICSGQNRQTVRYRN